MSLHLSSRGRGVLQSAIRSMSLACRTVNGINLAQGICDTEVPLTVRRAAKAAIDSGENTYTRYDGIPQLRQAIARKERLCYNLSFDPESQIIVSGGATGAFYCAILALLNPGDEVLVFEPYYGYHVNTLRALGCVPVFVPLSLPALEIDPGLLRAAVTSRTRAVIVNTPANPSGKVFTRAELKLVGDLAKKHDLFILTDEIYEHFVYDGRCHVPPASLPGLKERTITMGGLSKTFSITGWRIGYCICDAQWASSIGHFSDLVYVCAPAPLQHGAAAGLLKLSLSYYRGLSRSYQKKRDMVCAALAEAGLDPLIPQGSYYILADLSHVKGATSMARAQTLLACTGIACVPGDAFFHDRRGDHLGRFCFAKEEEILDQVCRRLRKFARAGA